MTRQPLCRGDQVRHPRFGLGEVVAVNDATAVVRFEGRLEECLSADLARIESYAAVLARTEWDSSLEVIARALGQAIRSVNDTWGVFSRSRIALLPHQLWVCRQVNRTWPARWLVADDVGLGKTIEAGLILLPLLATGQIRRLLILCPASLVQQWQYRLRTMFDIRLTPYTREADTPRSDFWNTHHQVIASIHTLRVDRGERHQRLLEADPWDMVLVDEAHHLNADEDSGYTLGYKLIEKLETANRIKSMIFFTGTPHRGKNFGFFALLHLLRRDLFDPFKKATDQFPLLRHVMIRNNKYEIMDLKGNRLFKEPLVKSEIYSYSVEERLFYNMLTEFIATGKAYARTLGATEGRAVMLVLIAMQKLASSSVAAIRRALKGRLERISNGRQRLDQLEEFLREYTARESDWDNDIANRIEEEIAELSAQVVLMNDEEIWLRQLVRAAEAIVNETKVGKIMEIVQGPFAGRSVLLFTEYKATQSLILSELIKRFGKDSVTFINGDERAEDVIVDHGLPQTLCEPREQAAKRFNTGEARFLVSTEAGGEGIDLQEKCYSLIHIDLPWNPMRLHQRVGRLNRYGQTRQVEVYSVRNPDTVEARIWEKLNENIAQVSRALRHVMAQPEDLLQLVLGMSPSGFFSALFADATEVRPESFSDWFDSRTAEFGGQDILKTVSDIVGNAARFDFQQVADEIPKLDLTELKPFFIAMLHLNKKKVVDDANGLSFHTPEAWLSKPGVSRHYSGMVFDRSAADAQKVLGVGHRLFDLAISQANELTGSVAGIPKSLLSHRLAVFRVTDRVTSQGGVVKFVVFGVEWHGEELVLLRDSDIIERLNRVLTTKDPRRFPRNRLADSNINAEVLRARSWLEKRICELNLPFQVPEVAVSCLFIPTSDDSHGPIDIRGD